MKTPAFGSNRNQITVKAAREFLPWRLLGCGEGRTFQAIPYLSLPLVIKLWMTQGPAHLQQELHRQEVGKPTKQAWVSF